VNLITKIVHHYKLCHHKTCLGVAHKGKKISSGGTKGKNIFSVARKGMVFFSGTHKGFAHKKKLFCYSGGERSFKGKMKTCREWHTGERKSQAVAQKGKTVFQWHRREQYFFGGHTRDLLIKKASVIHSNIALLYLQN
jgi:hypothetical protein